MAVAAAAPSASALRIDRRELAGAVGDVGVLVPIAVALIVSNGLSATAVLLPAGLLYLAVALVYRLPVPVQPLKAFGAIAIAKGLGANEIAAGALLMGVIFVVLGRSGLIDLAARAFPKAIIRGVQLSVGLLFLKIAWGLVDHPPKAFGAHALSAGWAIPLGALVLVLAIALRQRMIALVLVLLGMVLALTQTAGSLSLGPSVLQLPSLDGPVLWSALTLLVIPQLPLTFANSCIATSDAARTYFGARIRPGQLATSLGLANLFSAAIAGMPVCHGAGGMTAHRAFGARAPLAIGTGLVIIAVGLGASLATLLAAFPLAILAGMLATAGLLHIGLLRDLDGARSWTIALLVGTAGLLSNLAIGLALGLVLWWLPELLARRGRAPTPHARPS